MSPPTSLLLTVEPELGTLPLGDTVIAVAEARDASGARLNVKIGWESRPPGIVSVTPLPRNSSEDYRARIVALAPGLASIIVTTPGRQALKPVTVSPQHLVALLPAADSLLIPYLGKAVLRVDGVDRRGVVVPNPRLDWTSSERRVIDVDSTGLLTAVGPGRARVTFARPPTAGSISVSVSLPDTWSIRTSHEIVVIRQGHDVKVTAEPVDSVGRVIPNGEPIWATRDPSIAEADETGYVGSRREGQTILDISIFGRVREIPVRVVFNPVATVTVSPTAVNLQPGANREISVDLRDQDNLYLRRPVAWRSSDPAVASVSNAGVVTAHALGRATITATCEGISATVAVIVTELPLVTSIVIRPSRVVIVEGQTIRMNAILTGLDGVVQPNRRVPWLSNAANVLQIDTAGLVRGVAGGRAIVSAAVDSGRAESRVEVVPTAVQGPFNIELRPLGPIPPALAAALQRAVARWRRTITADVPDRLVRLASGECFPGIPELNEIVDDLVIYVGATDTLPGDIAGLAGSCASRDDIHLPLLSVAVFNATVIETALAERWLDALVTHELAHALGFGRDVWDAAGLLSVAVALNPFFRGTAATDQFALVGGRRSYSGPGVPLENSGGSGTYASHWRYSVMRPELMIPAVDRTRHMPMSRVTLGAMSDLGYTVDMEAWDEYALPFDATLPLRGREFAEVAVPLRVRVRRDGSVRRKTPFGTWR
ncbi:MAG: Ig-like domain-containing protein [Gemmatimonadota bacterium]